MKHGFLVFLFLALAMTVMSAPTTGQGQTQAVAKGAQPAANKGKSGAAGSSEKTAATSKKTGGAKGKRGVCKKAQQKLVAAKQKHISLPAPKKAGKKIGKSRRDLTSRGTDAEIFTRASETRLCGLKLRGKSSRMCQGNPAYLSSVWSPWDTIKNRMTSANIPSRYQCDHALELQLTAAALTASGFCAAWEEMRAAWKKYDRHARVDEIMSHQFFNGGFKDAANDLRMLFYVDTPFNEQKRAFTAAYLRGAPQQSTTQLQNYFHAGVVDIVDAVAANIDTAAYNLLNTINTMATPQNYDEETASAEEAELVCALDTAQTVTYMSWDRPVASYWAGIKAYIHPA